MALRPSSTYHRAPTFQNSNTSLILCDDHNCGVTQLGVWNAHSNRSKTTSVCEIITTNKMDILIVTETWLTENDTHYFPSYLKHSEITNISASHASPAVVA